MDIGFSCSVWASGERDRHLDGIGIYCQALWGALERAARIGDQPVIFKPYAFGSDFPKLMCGTPKTLAKRFKYHVLLSGLLNIPLPNSASIKKDVSLFHATDHQIPQIRGVPVVATIMDLIPQLHPEWIKQDLRQLKSWLFTQSIQNADHIITISEHSKQDIIDFLGIKAERISVTPLGVDPIYFERVATADRVAVLSKYNLKPGFFLLIGTLQPRKNVDRVLQAFLALPDSIRKEHPLIIVGRDGWNNEGLLPQLRTLEQCGEGKWLSYLPQTEVLALLQSAVALVFASLYEGFGLPVIEAFASQCPVIASNNSSIPEVTGDAAWNIDPTSVESISNAMTAVLENADLRNHKVASGVRRAKLFSWDECARQTLDIYRKVLAEQPTET